MDVAYGRWAVSHVGGFMSGYLIGRRVGPAVRPHPLLTAFCVLRRRRGHPSKTPSKDLLRLFPLAGGPGGRAGWRVYRRGYSQGALSPPVCGKPLYPGQTFLDGSWVRVDSRATLVFAAQLNGTAMA